MRLTALPAFSDNYIWLLQATGQRPIVVDPGAAAPVFAALKDEIPAAILLTHHHADHIGGVAQLRQHWPQVPVYAPFDERIALNCTRVSEAETVRVGGWEFQVLDVPGHTRSHIAFFGHGYLFCGDALFSLGCGRLFEGTAAQMLASLRKCAALPEQTQVCCAHEYTQSNAAFARCVEPNNPALQQRQQQVLKLRQHKQPSLPVTLANERQCNPFLRTHIDSVRQAVAAHVGRALKDEVDVFAQLRGWKDGFSG